MVKIPTSSFLCLLISLIPTAPLHSGEPLFKEVSRELGVDFKHKDGRSGKRYYVETSASGGGWFDFDNDGDQDLYLVNGSLTPGSEKGPLPTNALYENRNGKFVDITAKAGVGDTAYGMGFCTGDYDADGHLDLFITNYGADRLYRNMGDGTFKNVTDQAGVGGTRWGAGAAFGDVDGDGDLDLYVSNYVAFSYDKNPQCGSPTSNTISYCRPDVFDGQNDYLYINQGNGTFRDEALSRGITQGATAKSFGSLLTDIDFDGDLDIVVACDGVSNRFYLNDGRGHFEDQSLLSGLGFNGSGAAEAGMGLEVGDVNGDGAPDVMITNYAHETHTLYAQRSQLFFEDVTAAAGLAEASLDAVGWGVALFDMDNDRDLDIAVANGHVIDNIDIIEPNATYPQGNQLFENNGKGVFKDVSGLGGKAFTTPKVSRGLAVADFNNDGRLDMLITNTNSGVNLLQNIGSEKAQWIGFTLKGPAANPFAIGARIHLGDMVREIRSGGSFLSQHDLRAHFGLGDEKGPVTIEIHWPDGKTQTASFKTINRYHTVNYAP